MKRKLRLHKTIYVTGITGFIGSSLLPHLLNKYNKVINFNRGGTFQVIDKVQSEEKKISEEIIRENPSNILINLATLYVPYPNSTQVMENLIEANILFPSRVISSLSILEDLKIVNAVSYHQLLDFPSQNVYSLSKELFKVFLDHQELEIVNTYIFDTFGSGDTRNKVTDIFIKNILNGNDITIPSNEIKINLSDSEAVCLSMLNTFDLNSGSYSLLGPDTITLEHLARLIMKISKKEVRLIKANPGRDYFDDIVEFPENIFMSGSDYCLEQSLKNRIEEIKNT